MEGNAVEAGEAPASNTSETLRARYEQFRRSVMLEERWARRHPVYARLLYAPLLGQRLRARRADYVRRMMHSTEEE
jgi:hypothetical protein